MDEKILIINDDKYINDSQEAFNDKYFGSKRNTHMKKTYIVGVIISVMLLAACSNNVKPDTNNEVVTPSPTPIGFEYIPATDSPVSDVPLPTQVPTIAEEQPDSGVIVTQSDVSGGYKTSDGYDALFYDYMNKQEKIIGMHYKEVYEVYGEPSGMLSGFWGNIYRNSSGEELILYYDGATESVMAIKRIISDSNTGYIVFKNALCGKETIYYCQDETERILTIDDVPSIFDPSDTYMKIFYYAFCDIDGDGVEEAILQVIGTSGDMSGKLILHRINDKIYAYKTDNKNICELKDDGTYRYYGFLWSNDGIARITGFSESEYTEDRFTYETGDYEKVDSYVVNHESVGGDGNYREALRIQKNKLSVQWYEYSKAFFEDPNPTQMPSVDIEVPLTELEMLPRNHLAIPFSAKVKEYYDAQSEYSNTGILPDPRESDLNSLYFVYPGTRSDVNSTQTYLLYDLNNDGTPELFIARHYSSGYEQPDVIYDAYIWDDGQIKRLMNEKEIGYRNGTCEIREGGYILSFYSGSAWDFGYDVYRMDNDSKELRWIERIYAVKETENGNDDSQYYWSSSEFTDKKQISEERYHQLIGRYRTPELQFVENNGPQIS